MTAVCLVSTKVTLVTSRGKPPLGVLLGPRYGCSQAASSPVLSKSLADK